MPMTPVPQIPAKEITKPKKIRSKLNQHCQPATDQMEHQVLIA